MLDTPITRAEHEEFRRRIEDEHIRQNRRLELLEEMGEVSALLMLAKKMKFLFHLNLQKMHLMETKF